GCRSLDSRGLSSSSSGSASSSRVDQLPFEALPPAAVSAMPPPCLEAHLTLAYNALTEVAAPVRRQGQTLVYLQSLAPIPRVANLLVNSTFLVVLLRLLRQARPVAIRETVATLIGLLVRHATYIAPGAGRTPSRGAPPGGQEQAGPDPDGIADTDGLMPALIATAVEGQARGRAAQTAALRRNAVAALGELLFYVVTQEPHTPAPGVGGARLDRGGGRSDPEAWSLPIAAVGDALRKSLLVGSVSQEGVRHYAAKTLENVLAQVGPLHPLVSVLATPELALDLLDLARHASCENLKSTAAAGLSHLLGHDILGGECRRDHEDRHAKSNAGGGGGGSSSSAVRRRGGVRRQRPVSGHDDPRRPAPGWITARVMCEPGAPEAVVRGLSAEGSSAASRRAFLGVFNLVLWASRDRGDDAGVAVDEGWPETTREDEAASAGRARHSPLRRAAQSMLDSQQLLVTLLRIAEHGEGAVLRAKGFLAVRLALEAAGPAFLLAACRSRLLPVLARAIGGLAPRLHAARGLVGAAATAAVPVPELSPQQEYLYECSTQLAEWLCAVPETTARRVATELRSLRATEERHRPPQRRGDSRGGGTSRRSAAREQTAEAATAMSAELESAVAAFPAVVHLVNSPLLRRRAVTTAFVRDLADCVALSPPAADAGSLSGTRPGVLAALLPTVETLAQQAELLLLPHRDAVAASLVPELCRLLESPSGDTRTLIVAVFRALLPPLVRRQRSGTPPGHPSSRCVDRNPCSTASAAVGTAVGSSSPSENPVASAIAAHLLPRVPGLLRDYDPIPQYAVRLLLDVGREWGGLGPALLEPGRVGRCAAAALLDRMSGRSGGLSPRGWREVSFVDRGKRRAGGHEPGSADHGHVTEAYLGLAVAMLDSAIRRRAGARRDEALLSGAGYPGCSPRAAASTVPTPDREWKERQLSPLLAAAPAAVEALKRFCVQGAMTARCYEGEGGTLGVVDDGVRVGVSDSATLFLETSFEVRGRVQRRRFLLKHALAPSFPHPFLKIRSRPKPMRSAQQGRVHRHLADFLGCPDEDERPRLRVLRLLLAAASRLGQSFRGALRQGPLWTALLRLATGRGGGIGGGRGSGKATLGPASALARDVVAAVREDSRGGTAGAAAPRRWGNRVGSGRGGNRRR
ncbi:unnamed protein product, partial [Scytosiphon promiscuus]